MPPRELATTLLSIWKKTRFSLCAVYNVAALTRQRLNSARQKATVVGKTYPTISASTSTDASTSFRFCSARCARLNGP
eukprot:3169969-Amphidinium_carterae.1